MAHFAKLDENNIVIDVLVVSNDILLKTDGTESEYKGKVFLNGLFGNATWVQTSYNSNFRKQYAGIGFTYDETNDVFISIKPFNSWTLDSNFEWQPPTSYPTDNRTYSWNETNLSWDLFNPVSPYHSWTWNEEDWRWESPTPMPTDGQVYYWNEETLSWDLITE
jgi:hypothetical protein